MLTIPGRWSVRNCDGVSRRDFMQVGKLGLLGMTLSQVFELQDRARATAVPPRFEGATGFGRAKSVIMLFLQGGPSHIDIWDPKPDAPSNIRGEFKPIKTNIPGIRLSETMPKIIILTSVTSTRSSMESPDRSNL